MAKRRLEIGFDGGATLRLSVEQQAADALVSSLGGDGWQSVEAEEGTYWLNPNEVCYVRLVAEAGPKIGFGSTP